MLGSLTMKERGVALAESERRKAVVVSGCTDAVDVLNLLFDTALILNDGHEILARLRAGDELPDVLEDVGRKFGKPELAPEMRRVAQNWPPLHLDMVSASLQWALSKLDSDDRVTINWKGDAEHPETVTRLELRDHTLLIEFAHPPGTIPAAPMGA